MPVILLTRNMPPGGKERFALGLKDKLPKINLSFMKGSDGLDGEDDDDLDLYEKTRFQKMLPWLSVVLGYGMVVGGVVGTAIYLSSNTEEIAQAMREKRPSVTVEEITIRKVIDLDAEKAKQAAAEAAASDEETATAEAPASGEGPAAADPENPLLALMQPEGGDGAAESSTPDATAGTDEATADDPTADEAAGTEQVAAADPGAGAGENVEDPYKGALIPHPDPNLVEETSVGPLPKIAPDGRQPWQVYSRPFNVLETRPQIAILITDLGLSETHTEMAVELPGSMTLAFAPYSQKTKDWIQQARDGGHEVMLTLPMEPIDFPMSDPGPFALMSALDAKQNIEKLNWVMSRATGYVGMVNFQGSKFNSNKDKLRPVFGELAQRGLIYVETKETVVSIVPELGNEMNVPALSVDVILDQPPIRSEINARLRETEALAKRRKYAIALARPNPVTLDRLKSWSRDLGEKGLALIPVSAVIAAGLNKSASGS